MDLIISRCGNICSECPWSMYVRKKIKKEDWENYSEKIKEYTGYRPIKQEWEGCAGCLTPTEGLPKHPFFNFLKKCRTRKCTQHNDILNCAYCERFPCTNTVTSNNFTKEKISEKLQVDISDAEYERYIKMFDSMSNLKEVRRNLKDIQIKSPKLVDNERKMPKVITEFKNESFKFVYENLRKIAKSNLGIKGIDTIAGMEQFKKRENFFWRFLWIIGNLGDISENELTIDSGTLYDNRNPISLPSNEQGWKTIFNILSEFGINSEIEIKTDNLYTPGGYMRPKIPKTNKPAYIIKMKTASELQDYPFFKTLNKMLLDLQEKSGKNAYPNFKKLNFENLY